jgi:hypothetical protein
VERTVKAPIGRKRTTILNGKSNISCNRMVERLPNARGAFFFASLFIISIFERFFFCTTLKQPAS